MKKTLKSYIYTTASVAAVFGVVISPVIASAATDSDATTITATVGSTISVASTTNAVGLAITPVAGGAQTSASDTVTVNTNNAAGYTLTLADTDANTSLVKGVDTIDAHAGTFASPSALANNSWGYAVGGAGTFDASYDVLTNVTSSATLWAGVPATGSPDTLKSTSSTASGDVTTVWYAAKIDTSKPNGAYVDSVTYTATTK